MYVYAGVCRKEQQVFSFFAFSTYDVLYIYSIS